MSTFFKSILPLPLAFVLVLLIFMFLLRLLENRLTFFPRRELELYPRDFALEARELWLVSGGGNEHLHGWYFAPEKQAGDSASDSTMNPVFIVFHGNGGNISHRLEWLAPFIRRGAGAILFDYRGYGRSEGKPGETNFQEDALTVYQFLVKDRQVAPERVVPVGRSLGSAPASWLAARVKVRALILEGAFSSGRDMARKIFGFLPVHLIMKNKWEVAEQMSRVSAPVLILHGTEDEVVPFSLGQKLAQGRTARAGRPKFIAVDGGGHLSLEFQLESSYYQQIMEFIRSAGE